MNAFDIQDIFLKLNHKIFNIMIVQLNADFFLRYCVLFYLLFGVTVDNISVIYVMLRTCRCADGLNKKFSPPSSPQCHRH